MAIRANKTINDDADDDEYDDDDDADADDGDDDEWMELEKSTDQ